jgi:dCTP deaminase
MELPCKSDIGCDTSHGILLSVVNAMILSDVEIRREIERGGMEISPFDEAMLQPASYDLKIGKDVAVASQDGRAKLDLEAEKIVIIPPYTPAVIYTMEHLKLSLSLLGRFGLKSSLSRRGMYGSVGLQVDPGFKGNLSVTLFNITPVGFPLNFGDSFLSLELHRLETPASRGYSGEFQGKTTFDAKDIEPVLGYRGGLGEVVKGFDEVHKSIERLSALPERFDGFLKGYEKQNQKVSEFNQKLINEIHRLVEHIVGERTQTVVLRAITRQQAKAEILDLFKNSNETLFYSDIAERLRLDLELVVELCNELEKEGCIGVLNKR